MDKSVFVTLGFCSTILFLLYFLILAAERVQSLVRAGRHKVLLDNGLHKYMIGLCLISFVGTIVLLGIQCFRLLQGVPSDSPLATMSYMKITILLLCSAVGCLLLSGMVHTEYSLPGLQFTAYGILIVGMILRVVMQYNLLTPGKRALALLYVVAFSMAIPVVYPSKMEHKQRFHIIESIVSFGMVILFTIMLYALLSGQYSWIFHPAFLALALIGDIPVLLLRWKEEVNWFVLVSLAITVLLWIIGAFFGMVLMY